MQGRLSILAAFAILFLFTAPAPCHGTDPVVPSRRHPQDGPHADVRLAVEGSSVSIRVTMNYVFMDGMIETARENADRIDPVEEAGIAGSIQEYFRAEHPVLVDGIEVAPARCLLVLNDPDLSLLPLFPRTGIQGLRKVQCTLEYPVTAPPRRVSFTWMHFPADVLLDPDDPPPLVIMAELTAEGRRQTISFTHDEPQYTWHWTGTELGTHFEDIPPYTPPELFQVPMISLAMVLLFLSTMFIAARGVVRPWIAAAVGAPLLVFGFSARDQALMALPAMSQRALLPSIAEAEAIFLPLHGNIYRAFEYTSESDIYDALARSVDGALLESLYTQVYRSLIMQDEGGAVSRVQVVRPLEISIGAIGLLPGNGESDSPRSAGFNATFRWQVDGAVYHWGHVHERTNEYHARYAVQATTDGWRITGSDILDQFRVDAPGTEPAASPSDERDDL